MTCEALEGLLRENLGDDYLIGVRPMSGEKVSVLVGNWNMFSGERIPQTKERHEALIVVCIRHEPTGLSWQRRLKEFHLLDEWATVSCQHIKRMVADYER